jgi:hypothetical protein
MEMLANMRFRRRCRRSATDVTVRARNLEVRQLIHNKGAEPIDYDEVPD